MRNRDRLSYRKVGADIAALTADLMASVTAGLFAEEKLFPARPVAAGNLGNLARPGCHRRRRGPGPRQQHPAQWQGAGPGIFIGKPSHIQLRLRAAGRQFHRQRQPLILLGHKRDVGFAGVDTFDGRRGLHF